MIPQHNKHVQKNVMGLKKYFPNQFFKIHALLYATIMPHAYALTSDIRKCWEYQSYKVSRLNIWSIFVCFIYTLGKL